MMMGVCGVWGQDPVATPEISFSKASCQVSITCATDGASIYYRTDGSDPDISAVDGANPTKTYSGAFTINGTTTVKAIATKANYSNSAVQTSPIEFNYALITDKNGYLKKDVTYQNIFNADCIWTHTSDGYLKSGSNYIKDYGSTITTTTDAAQATVWVSEIDAGNSLYTYFKTNDDKYIKEDKALSTGASNLFIAYRTIDKNIVVVLPGEYVIACEYFYDNASDLGTGLLTDPGTGENKRIDGTSNTAKATARWNVTMDDNGFYSFQNVGTNRYITLANNNANTQPLTGKTTPNGNTYKMRINCYRCATTKKRHLGISGYNEDFSGMGITPRSNVVNNITLNNYNSGIHGNGNTGYWWYFFPFETTTHIVNPVISGSGQITTTGDYAYYSSASYYKSVNNTNIKSVNHPIYTDTHNTGISSLWSNTSLPSGSTMSSPNTNSSITLTVASLPDPNTTFDLNCKFTIDDAEATITKTIIYIVTPPVQEISHLSEINNIYGNYKLNADISGETIPAGFENFSGILDGNFHTISGLSSPLFSSTNDATIKNVILDNVHISGGTNVGAICGEARGVTCIYNCGVLATNSTVTTDEDGYTKITSCSSTISGNGYVGGIVGLLDGRSRVINCYSYANITGGNLVGGIVGKNNVATTSSNLQTMVMNCMFYGDIDNEHCTSKAPIYNGEIITNDGDADGVNNFNYFWAGASYVQGQHIDVYNCALAAETRYLQRFEFFRHLLNSNRELAAWWATGDTDNKGEMMKWVLEPSQIGTSTPYPILKAPDRYPSVVNIDVNHSDTYKGRDMTVGPKLSKTLSVTIRNSTTDAVYGAPTGANITNTSLSLNIMDKDPDHFNFNYYKVQLPYYNDVGTGNYTGNRVVTGWKIVTISGGTTVYSTDNDNNATTPADAEATISSTGDITLDKTPYNFADRNCTDKDKYGVSGRVFNQGAYWDVPEGVTAITIEPYWGKAVYLSDAYWDVTYQNGTGTDSQKAGFTTDAMTTAIDVTSVGGGQHYSNGVSTFNGQLVYTSMGNAISSTNSTGLYVGVEGDPNDHSVYDYAVVLVGNYHHNTDLEASNSKPYTVTSVDLDGDNEPDYSYILRFNNRLRVHPVRIDFLNAIGLGMAQKTTGGAGTYNFGIMQPKGWFESTNTALFRMTQFEYDYDGRTESPMILQGGVIEQWVTVGGSEPSITEAKTVSYYHVGGNVWFKEFHIGVHQDKIQDQFVSPHPPISVTGGDFDEFYLTGLYNTPNNTYPDNAECYINGGRFGKVAGTGMQGIGNAGGAGVTGGPAETGNIIWQIDNADIDEFYAGGINAAHIAEGNIYTVITNSRVDQFCGGPKFGNMNSDKKVVTNATNCTFRTFFGAGYGGNSYNRRYPKNQNNVTNINWNSWLTGTASYDYSYDSGYGGVETRIDYQFIPMSNNFQNVARLFVDYVSFSLATTHDVTSKLTDCTITTSSLGRLSISADYKCLGSFYGGGSLGMVTGDVKSILTNCTVEGNVFGGGYSATLPTVKVMNNSFQTSPRYDQNLGAYLEAKLPATVDYTWEHATETEFNNKQIDTGKKILYTTEDLTGLGAVTGNVTLTIDGNTTLTNGKKMSVTKSVYGGGEESNVEGNTQVNINGGTITENVFGGGKGEADEFSCSKAMIGVNNTGAGADLTMDENKNKGTKVTISNGQVNGNVYGGGEVGRVEWNTQVKIGVGTGNGPFAPVINGSVFGAGKGEKTHGYAALVRGNSTVTIQGNAKVRENVYGGGEQATVGRYWVKGINNVDSEGHPISGAPSAPTDMPDEMPYKTMSGGQCTVTIQGSAQIGPESGAASETTGHVFGAGKGVTPNYVHTGATTNWSKRMVDYNSEKHISGEGGNEGQTWDYYVDDKGKKDTRYVWEYFVDDADPTAADYKTGEAKYLEFLQTLALVTGTDVTINGATVKGNVYGGSESGFVQDDTDVKIQAGTIGTSGTTTYGNVFGGGKGLAAFAEAGKVKGNTEVAISGGTAHGNVYGGGELGDVGTINKANIDNYTWSGYDDEDPTNDTGKCKVSITNAAATVKGDVFGAGQGSGVTFQCEKAMAYNTEVTISAGTVNGNIYGGGKIGRVENNTKVKIGDGSGSATGTAAPVIAKSVFGAGQGLKTHGYSALVRGNTEVTVEGNAKVGKNVYGGGEIASVGRYGLNPQKMPNILLEGGDCKVTIQGYAVVGPEDAADDEGNVFGAGRGVDTPYDNTNKPQRMTLDGNGNTIPETIDSEEAYQTFLETLALATKPEVTIGGNATVNGSVFGGGELGLTKGSVIVTINGGTIERDVYGGGALAHTNTTDKKGVKENGVWKKENGEYVTTDVHPTTYVKLLGGIIGGEAYGGGLGDANTPAYVYGDVLVDLNGTTTMNTTTGKPTTDGASIAGDAKGCVVNQIFGCNNINGTPKGDVMVHVFATQNAAKGAINGTVAKESEESDTDYLQRLINVSKNGGTTVAEGVDATVIASAQVAHDSGTSAEITAAITAVTAELGKMYDVQAVYGGGNNAAYIPTTAYTESTPTGSKAQVVIEGCDYTSIQYVYGGGNAAPVPDTYVLVKGTKIIDYVFGGGNGTVRAADVGYDGNGNNQGDGNANTTLMAGTIHNVYGASNTNGDIRGKANITKLNKSNTDTGCCDKLVVNKMYSAGKDADISGGSKVILGCMEDDWIEEYYGGAENANVLGDVELTITSGKFRKVFGGNKTSGAIFGHIKVNIEETGCIPIYIDELYGCGNEAPYSIYGYSWDGTSTNPNNGKKIFTARTSASNGTPVKPDGSAYTNEGDDTFTAYDSPEVNIISATHIGKVFGGGLGSNAIVYGNPTVNINMIYGTPGGVTATALGEIGDVYGGGNAAAVHGNTTVNVGNLEYVEMTSFDKADVRGYYTRSGDTYSLVEDEAEVEAAANTSYYKEVVGANITGNVFGAGKGKDDNVETALVRGNATVNMAGGTVKGNIYGGGELSSVGDFTYDTNKMVTACTTTTGTTTVNISGGTIGDESEYTYDANNTITQTNGGNVFAGGKGSLRKADNSGYLPGWYKFAKVKNTVLNISGTTTRIMSNAYGGGELATVGYETSGTTHSLVGGTSVTISGGTIGTEIQSGSGTSATTEYTFGSLYGGGFGSDVETTISGQTDNTDPYAPKFYAGRVYGSTSISMSAGAVKASVYGGGQLASVGATGIGGNAVVAVSGGTVGINKVGDVLFGGATMGNVYGGGSGKNTIVRAGQIFGNTTVTISGTPTIYHNIYGGGAYGSVGDFNYTTETATSGTYANIAKVNGINSGTPLLTTGTGKSGIANVTVTGGTIGVDGKENGMVFGSSRGDVGTNRDKWQAWVYKTNVVIGTEGEDDGPAIKGSVYGSGENGHVYTDTDVKVHSGTIGIYDANDVVKDGDGNVTKDYNATRGNVYGGGCGEDTYPSDTEVKDKDNVSMAGKFEPSAGIVYGTAKVTMTGGQVLHNIYGAGALGSVGKPNATTGVITDDGGSTIIAISGGTVGDDGTHGDGNIFGAARGNATSTQDGVAQVRSTSVTISGATTGTIIKGNVYGGGQMGNVQATTTVDIQGGAIKKNVYGGGMGDASTFTCAKAMVGIADEGAGADPGTDTNKNKGTSVTISNGTVGTLNSGNLVDGTGNVYGGGQIARVEWNTQVTIGLATGSGTPYIYGNVFGAGKGLETHGYSALVRGNSTVIVQGNAQVGKNVYGGGEKATVGRYWVKDINNKDGNGDVLEAALPVPDNLPSGMPYKQQSGGICRVTIQGSAEIGYNGAADNAGHVFGAGQGVEPSFVAGTTERMVNNNTGGSLIAFTDDTTTGKTAEQLYLEFLETLALVTNSYVTIDESAKVKGSVFGGSESGFVQHDTNVTVNNGTIGTNGTTASYGNVFGGGRGLEAFAEAGKVKGNTTVNVSNGIMYGNVYGGGNLGDVGTIDKTDINNYTWSGYDDTDPSNDTGICTVSVAGGTVQKNVFGAGKGSGVTFQCEKAMAYNTKVSVSGGTVNGNVYGGGEIGRVENDTQVTIGRKTEETEGNGTGTPDIKGSVFGAGKGLATHGYSALVRGNTAVTVEGASGAKVGVDVYGGGEIASVGRYGLNPQKMPNILLDGGRCIVKVLGNVVIGPANASDDKGNVFGAGKGVSDPLDTDNEDKSQRSRRMTVYTNSTDFPEDAKLPATGTPTGLTPNGTTWEYYASGSPFVWEYFQDNAKYNTYLETLALATHPEVTIAGGSTINSSVFGGGELGLTKGSVIVNINGGTIVKDVYGGGSLANTNTTDKVGVKDNVNGGWKKKANGEYETTDVAPTTTVNLQGGIMRHAYGGGLGRVGANPIEAKVYGDVTVKLNEGKSTDDTGAKVDRVFGANNLNGSPQGNVTVRVYATQNKDKAKIGNKNDKHDPFDLEADDATTTTYDVIAVYGGGNEAAYIPGTAYTAETPTGSKTQVFIEGCDATSIKTVYGGGNAASVPESNVTILSAYEIERVFGGGNGKDDTSYGTNPGADIGVYKNASNEDVIYGTGNANTDAQGGYIHELYGASNEKGTIKGNISLKTEQKGNCTLKFDRIYNASKNADVEGDMIAVLGCQPDEKIPEYYGGAENANVKGNVELTITSGTFGQIFAGNNKGGAIFGHIKLNIEETGCRPIIIDELYGCGNNAAYSVYGYYHASEDNNNQAYSDEAHTTPLYKKLNETDNLYYLYWDDKYERPFFRPRTSADDSRAAVFFGDGSADDHTKAPYAHPEVNIISCTSIGKVFGGGLGSGAVVYGNPTVNINQIYGTPNGTAATTLGEIGGGYTDGNNQYVEGGVFGGGNAADVIGNTTVNIGTVEKIRLHESWTAADGYTMSDDEKTVLGANIVGNVYGGGNEADITGDTHVNICAKEVTTGTTTTWQKVNYGTDLAGVSIDKKVVGSSVYGGSVYGGGCSANVLGNTNVRMSGGYVFNGIFGGGYAGNVGTFSRSYETEDVNVFGHTAHTGCIGKPVSCEEGTGKCTVVVDGGQIGPIEVATLGKGMNRPESEGGPVPQGWVWGGGQGLIEDPANHPDTHFKSYVGSTDVTIGGTALVMESIIGGGEFGRVLGDTKVTITGHCQIGVGEGKVDENNKPIRYTDDLFIDPTTTTVTTDNALAACSHFPYGKVISGKTEYLPYDPYYDKYYAKNSSIATSDLAPASTANPSDGKTWIGCVFAGGSGYMPYEKEDETGYDWCSSAGLVEGNTELIISGGHILTNVYGGNEVTNVKGKCKVTMTGGTIGVPRTLQQILDHPVICNLFGAGKGDQRKHFNKFTNVEDVEVTVTGGIIYGSVFGGGEDGHVLRDVAMTIGDDDHTGPIIGSWGTSYMDGNVFGGGRGFGGDAYTAGNVAGCVDLDIKGGNILGSVYGGGRLGSVGYGLFDATTGGSPTPGYGEMRDDNDVEEGFTDGTTGFFTHGRGHIDITISGGTIGNKWEYEFNPNDTYKTTYVPNTEYDSDNRLKHTKGGNVFAGGMGRLYQLDGTTPISSVDWWKLGCVKSTKLTITGGTIKSCVYGGGELGQVVGYHTTKNTANENINAGTEIIIQGTSTTIGTEIKDGSDNTQYTFGSVFGGGYGSLLENKINDKYPKFDAGLVKEDTKIDMQNGAVKASIYGGGEMASVGESTTSGETTTATGSTYVSVSGGTIGIAPITVGDNKRYFGGAKMGNVYGGGSGHGNTVRSGLIHKNTNVTISGGTIYHNVYGGGAYGTVGNFDYQTGSDYDGGPIKVQGINGLATTGTGVANVTITGGTIGYDGKENGMVFGSSRGDINAPGQRDDHTAWVYDTHVTIGETNGDTSTPLIKGSIYGSGENGHTFNDTEVIVHSGTIGVTEDDALGGANYKYRGNVYGGGCGTDTYSTTEKYDSDGDGDIDDNDNEKSINAFNPLAGIVYGTTTININGGTVARNVYGAGAMGSVGKTTWTTTSTTKSATTTGGSTTININGGTIGVSGTVGDGNVFGAARGSKDVVQTDRDDLSRVRETNVTVSNGNVKGNVYGGGELGDVGTIIKNTTNYNYTWEKSGGGANAAKNNGIAENNTNTGICNVTIEGGTIGSTTAGTGNVFGGGKGDANTWWCEKAMAFATNVSISGSDTKVYGTVYGGGEIGRVEDDTKVIIGTENGSDIPDIKGNVFGAGKGMATRGYSALVRGNSIVTIQGSAKVGGNVFGGGEEASLGRFVLDKGLPKSPQSGGYSTVTIQDNAKIGSSGTGNHVYGAGQGVAPNYDEEHYKNFKSMQLYDNRPKNDKDLEGTYWDYYVDEDNKTDNRFVWVYYKTEPEYQAFLNTLALASHPTVTIAENATIYGDVYGGGQRGITLGNVAVNITGGTVKKDVYGGGSLADTNKGNWDDSQYVPVTLSVGHTLTDLYTKTGDTYIAVASDATATSGTTYYSKGTWATGKYVGKATTYKTNVALTGGTIEGNVYGGGLGQIARAASAAQGTEGQEGYVPAVTKLDEVKAKVYGDVLVTLNKPTTSGETTTYGNCVVKENIFGCNNQNGSPQSAVTVHVYKTEGWTGHEGTSSDKLDSEEASDHSYHLNGVYGGGNLSAFYPDLKETRDTVQAFVIIDGCDQTSIKQVYGGGNAASIPATNITINASYEIEEVFGGGNGLNEIIIHDQTMTNPGANVGYEAYPISYDIPESSKEERTAKFSYGSGKSSVTIYDGLIHRVFGGSNKKGNVRESAVTLLDDQNGCHFQVDEAYGGGKNAPMDAEAKLLMACIPGLKVAYGGAQEADVLGGVTLTITNGTYERVFGGNNISGTIQGPIVVNIEETGCRPIIIGELYGGGNQAAYSVYGYKMVNGELKPRESASDGDAIAGTPYADPVVNVKSFTSIGTIYGGGYGETAVMVGNPTVNIDVFKGQYADDEDNVINENAKVVGSTVKYSGDGYDTGFPVPSHAQGAIGAIGTVFGGGNAAKVIGTPTVNIGTRVGEQIDLLSVPVEDSNGKTSSEAGWIPTYQKETVLGADIRGDIYGAGNNAEVTGDTKVQIGKKIETSTTPDPDPTPGP